MMVGAGLPVAVTFRVLSKAERTRGFDWGLIIIKISSYCSIEIEC